MGVNHGRHMLYRSRVGKPTQGTDTRTCTFTAVCLCGEKFTGEGPNYNKAAEKARKKLDAHVAELLKNCENSHSTGVESQ
jgi:hypothetical protein